MAVLTLLVELPPWRQVFLGNLKDSLWKPQPPPLRLASRPADFWPDVFVASHLPWGRFLQSLVYHVAAIALVWAAAFLVPRRVKIAEQPEFHHEDVIYYAASEYLKPLNTGVAHVQLPHKGDPAFAPQPIISVPPEADNQTQTIVAPPKLKLDSEVPLPNVVAWAHTLLSVPIQATERVMAAVRDPSLNVPAVAPPPDVNVARSAPSLRAPQPAVVEPPPTVAAASVRLGEINIGPASVVAPAPKLSVGQQRTLRAAPTGLGNASSAVVPPPPLVGSSGISNSGDRLIALGIHPASLRGPVQAPAGNRRGSFAANPRGKPGAPGTPDISGKGPGTGNSAGSGSRADIPPGLFVGAGPDAARDSAIGGNGAQSNVPALMAKATPPRVASVPRRTAVELSNSRATEEEKQVFGDRKFYSMTLNMPNLNSAGGSWVIHFAELKESEDKGDLVAPTAIVIADPAYPLELMRQSVQGTVTLYAVIRSDGSVADVRVLRSVDDRLGQYAADALGRWQFRPASKNGNAVDLAAVVTIPFRSARMKSGF